ncbi:unnamed protein product [Schistosoma margrebowiei]|uniref:Uncharacterized protein n=1 Tax=Schistosoma margrebowiei TaxID=48269 RepID=A0AA85AGV0_9TREM|nr:unnamed protein product [Schistosoma margrebowiei]
MVLLFLLLGILQGYAHSSAKTPSPKALINMSDSSYSATSVVTPTESPGSWTTRLRDWFIYLLSLLTKVFGSHSEFMQKLLGLVDKTTSVSNSFLYNNKLYCVNFLLQNYELFYTVYSSFPLELSIGRGIRTTCNATRIIQ